MRNIFETIDSLAASGITLNMEADKIRVFPKTLVTAEVRLVIRTYRAELVSALVMIDPANDSTDCPPVAARMFWAKHQSTLLANGWTSSEFWKRYPQPGVGWVRVWSDPSWDLSLQPEVGMAEQLLSVRHPRQNRVVIAPFCLVATPPRND